MEIILLIIRIFLFAVFALAGIGKLLDLEGSEKAVKAFGTPEEFAKTFAIALPFAEIIFAFCFLFTETSWLGSLGSLILLFSFIGGMIWQMSLGNAPDCHCFGQIKSEPVGKKSLIRNIIFALLTLFLVAQGRDSQGLSLADTNAGIIQAVLLLLLVVLSGVVIFYLKTMYEQQQQIMRRIELLELISREGVALERHEAGDPSDGLPIGAPFPDFTMPDTFGNQITLEHLLSKGKPLLFFFVSPTCEPCSQLLPEIETWQSELSDKVETVFVSSGKAKENLEKFAEQTQKQILLQEKREFAELVKALWTPTAIFVSADGTISSHLAAGDTAIRELIGKVKTEDLNREFVYFTNGNHNGKPPKIGEEIPQFSLKDINDREIRTSDFIGKETLAVFWSLDCPHCKAMIPDLRAWDNSKTEGDPNLVMFSDGAREDYAGLNFSSPIVLEKEYETAMKMGMHGTPSAVLINKKGLIVTEAAVGGPNIWALLGKRK